MKTRTLSLIVAVLTAAGGSRLAAQGPRFSLGGGLTLPGGGYGTADGPGWHVLGVATRPLSVPHMGLRVDAMYGRTPREGLETGHTTLVGGTAGIVWRLPGGGPHGRPYLVTGLGLSGVTASAGGRRSAAR